MRATAMLVVMGCGSVFEEPVSKAGNWHGASGLQSPVEAVLRFCPVAASSSHRRPSWSPTKTRAAPSAPVMTVATGGTALSCSRSELPGAS